MKEAAGNHACMGLATTRVSTTDGRNANIEKCEASPS